MALTPRTLSKLASEYHAASRREADAKADKKKIAARVIPDLTARGVKAIEAMGWRVSLTVQHETKYDMVKMRRVLGKDRFIRATKRVPDPDAITQMLGDGSITPKELARFSTREAKSPYITPSPIAETD